MVQANDVERAATLFIFYVELKLLCGRQRLGGIFPCSYRLHRGLQPSLTTPSAVTWLGGNFILPPTDQW